MLAFLLKVEGQTEKKFTVDAATVVIGSDAGLPIVLADPDASPRHIEVSVRGVGVVLKDLATEKGTRVNGDLVSQVRLSVGDEVQIGKTRIYLTMIGAESAREPARARAAPPKIDRAPIAREARGPREKKKSLAVPILMVFLLLAGGAAAVFILNQPKSPKSNIAKLPPKDTAPADGKQPEESAETTDKLGLAIPDEPIPGSTDFEPEDPAGATPPPVAKVPEPAAPSPAPAVAVPAKKSAAERLRELEERERLEAAELKAIHRYERFAETLPDRIARYSFDGPIADLELIAKPLPIGSARGEALGQLADLRGALLVFERLKEVLGSGRPETVTLSSGLELFVTGANEDGFTAKVGSAETKKKWTELDPKTVHVVVAKAAKTADQWIELSGFAALFELEDAEYDLIRAFKADEKAKREIDDTLARRRGIEVPAGGFLLHDGGWVTPEEKDYLDRGYKKYEGRWLTHDDWMTARGFTKHEGRWLSPERYKKVLEAQQRADELAKKYMPKGLLDKPGYGDVKPWKRASGKAPVEIKTKHYKICTDLSKEVGKDLAYTMEILNMNLKSEFGIRGKGARFKINVVGNRGEYMAFWPRVAGRSLGFCTMSEICTFYQPPMTTGVLMHEGTHQILRKFASTCPRWLHEGVACYFECSRFTFNEKRRRVELEVGLLNSIRCQGCQAQIRSGRAVPIETFIRGKGGDPYQQGWAFVYYLAKGKDGKYAPRLHEFIGEAHKKDVVERFQRIFKVRDMEEFDREWREWVLALDPRKGVSLNSNHR